MSLSWQQCTHLYYSPLSLCLTAAAHVTHLSTRTHTYRNIWTTPNQRGGPPFTISDWFRPRYKPNGSVFCWVSESRILLFYFLEWLDAPVRPGIFVSRTREKLGRTLEPCIREHNFGPLSSSPVLFVFSPGETLLTLSVVQEWLDTRNATAETHVLHTSVRSGSWSTDSSCSPLFVNLPHIFEWVLFHNPLQGAIIPIACTLFSTTSFPSLRLSINVLGHRALWTASLFCNDLLCLALLVQGVNGRLLDNCQVSSLPHDCVAYRTRLRDHLKAFAGVLS